MTNQQKHKLESGRQYIISLHDDFQTRKHIVENFGTLYKHPLLTDEKEGYLKWCDEQHWEHKANG